MENTEIQISPERQEAFIEFVRSLPRTCSPSMFSFSDGTESSSSKFFCESPKKNRTTETTADNNFQWSIDDYAMIYGQDFSNEHELDDFNVLIHTTLSKELDTENERFFSQDLIIPSPDSKQQQQTNSQISWKSQDITGSGISRSTGSFIRLLDNLPVQCHSTQYGNDILLQQQENNEQQSPKQNNDISMRSWDKSTPTDNNFNPSSSSGGMELSFCSGSGPKFQMDFPSVMTPDIESNSKRFIEDISPIVSMTPNNKQKIFTPNNLHHHPFNINNKENIIGPDGPMSSPIYCGGTVIKKRMITFGSASITHSDGGGSPNLRLLPGGNRIPLASNQKQHEFKTPPQPAWRSTARAKIFRAKLLFQEFASTPNNNNNNTPSPSTIDNFNILTSSPQQVQS